MTGITAFPHHRSHISKSMILLNITPATPVEKVWQPTTSPFWCICLVTVRSVTSCRWFKPLTSLGGTEKQGWYEGQPIEEVPCQISTWPHSANCYNKADTTKLYNSLQEHDNRAWCSRDKSIAIHSQQHLLEPIKIGSIWCPCVLSRVILTWNRRKPQLSLTSL